jgi:hypothetical protein
MRFTHAPLLGRELDDPSQVAIQVQSGSLVYQVGAPGSYFRLGWVSGKTEVVEQLADADL